MPRALAPAVRLAICRRHRVGQSVLQIAGELLLAERTVRHVLQQFRLRGEESLRASYVSCGRSSSTIMRNCDRTHGNRRHPGSFRHCSDKCLATLPVSWLETCADAGRESEGFARTPVRDISE